MKKLLYLLLVLPAVISCGKKDKKPEWVTIEQDFITGKNYQYTISKMNYKSSQPETKDVIAETEVTLKIDSTSLGYLIATWKYGETTLANYNPENIDSTTKALLNTNENLELVLALDSAGLLVDLVNYDSVVSRIRKQFTDVMSYGAKVSGKEKDPETNEKVMEFMEPLISNPNSLLTVFYPEVGLVFGTNGSRYKVDSTYSNYTSLDNPFGGTPFPSLETISFQWTEDSKLFITVSQMINSEKAKEILYELFQSMALTNNRPFTESDIPDLNIHSACSYKYNLEEKLITSISYEKTVEVEMNGQKQEQVNKITIYLSSYY